MAVNFLNEANALRDELIEIRKSFHRIPELGNKEFRTSALIAKYLDESGITYHRVLDTGIVARIDGKKPGRNSAVRADIDALPVNENTGCDFASENPGMMHACGHDVHITGALGAAMLLKAHENDLCGSVSFFFQPNEEGDGGANRMIHEGCLEGIEAVFGCHVDPALPAGHVGIRYGNFYAASATFKVIIHGKSAHGAQRDKGIDSIEVSAHIIPEILKISGGVVSVGMIHAGTANNILAGTCEFYGIVRTFGVNERSRMCNELKEICENVSAGFKATCECIITDSCPGIVNDNDAITSLIESTARKTFGDSNVHVIDKPLFISEDFGYFIMARTGCFYHIGAGSEYPLHSDKFLPEPDAIITAAALHAAAVTQYNKKED